jgi:hypothetical protein
MATKLPGTLALSGHDSARRCAERDRERVTKALAPTFAVCHDRNSVRPPNIVPPAVERSDRNSGRPWSADPIGPFGPVEPSVERTHDGSVAASLPRGVNRRRSVWA